LPAIDIAAIDAIPRRPMTAAQLVALLTENSPIFAGRGTNETERLRGHILARFEEAGLPDEGMPFVLEELETGRNPFAVAGAARALRRAPTIPAEAPALLIAALKRLRSGDDVVSFGRSESTPATGGPMTMLGEIARTLACLGPRASSALSHLQELMEAEGDSFSPGVRAELAAAAEAIAGQRSSPAACCCEDDVSVGRPAPVTAVKAKNVENLVLEDQDGSRLTFAEAFSGRPTALAFFYTRCMNPEKCSATITRLARLVRRLEEDGSDANVAGITYDPGFDRPARLRTYGSDRGMVFSHRCRLLRTVGPFEPLQNAFDLGVGYGPVTVNRHSLDLVVLDHALNVTARFGRRLWQEEAVLDALRAAQTTQPMAAAGSTFTSVPTATRA
jgi:protein SCO1/2